MKKKRPRWYKSLPSRASAEEVESWHFIKVLESVAWNRTHASKVLKKSDSFVGYTVTRLKYEGFEIPDSCYDSSMKKNIDLVLKTIAETKTQIEAAEKLGVNPITLRSFIRKCRANGIEIPFVKRPFPRRK